MPLSRGICRHSAPTKRSLTSAVFRAYRNSSVSDRSIERIWYTNAPLYIYIRINTPCCCCVLLLVSPWKTRNRMACVIHCTARYRLYTRNVFFFRLRFFPRRFACDFRGWWFSDVEGCAPLVYMHIPNGIRAFIAKYSLSRSAVTRFIIYS